MTPLKTILVITIKESVVNTVKSFTEFEGEKATEYFIKECKKINPTFTINNADKYIEEGYFQSDNNSINLIWI
jgi:hypothetical protein